MKMNDKHECEITIVIDEKGEWCVCKTDDDYIADELSNLAEQGGTMVRRIDIKHMIAAPQLTEGTVTVPDEAGTIGDLQVTIA